jgi:hypothetical protein
MKRFALLLVATAAALIMLLPATAGAATFKGVVIAKDSARKSLVTASGNGIVRTVRLTAGFKRTRVGGSVVVRGSKLPDGTFSAAAVKGLGKSRGTHVRGTVVRRLGAQLIISAGGSVFALRLSGKRGATDGGLKPGDRVDCHVRFKHGTPQTNQGDIDELGHDGQLVLEGIYLSADDDGTIELAVVHRGRVFVHVPEDVEAPAFGAGDEVALVVTVEEDGSFTLVKGENENEPGDDSQDDDVDIDDGQFSVVGVLSALTEESVGVKVEGRPEPVRCAVSDEVDLEGFAVGQRVYMTCKYRDGRFELLALKQKDTPPSGDYFGVLGTISSFDSSHVTLDVEDREEPVTCHVPAGMDLLGFATGDEVKMYCQKVDGNFVVKALISDHASSGPDGSWFYVEGTILEVNSVHVSVSVEGHPSPVTCAVLAGADLSGFAAGDDVTMKCKFFDGGFKLKLLQSATAHYELT